MIRIGLFLFLLLVAKEFARAQAGDGCMTPPLLTEKVVGDKDADTLSVSRDTIEVMRKKPAYKRPLGFISDIIEAFNDYDTTYIEPNHYNFTAMVQGTMSFERYQLLSKSGQSVMFKPDNSFKIGPYFGWRWIFMGYTFDLKHFGFGGKSGRHDFDFSIYTALFGIDLYWRKSNNDYNLRELRLPSGGGVRRMKNVPFSGITVGVTGITAYYIFNHRHFSYPAAYNQSTCQRRSAGTLMVGFGHPNHSLDFSHEKLDSLLSEKKIDERLDTGLYFNKLRYVDIAAYVGYSYNWVFARNWLFNATLNVGLAYNYSKGVYERDNLITGLRNFSFNNFYFDAYGRFGLVWNNSKWFAGLSAIVHNFNYRKPAFRVMDVFGNVNVYAGFNFGRRKKK